MEKSCQACRMPLTKRGDFASGDENSNFCLYCVGEDGNVKSCDEIFEGGVKFFMSKIGGDKETAEKIVRKNMNQLPYWQGKDCKVLKWEMATDEEFAEVLNKLG